MNVLLFITLCFIGFVFSSFWMKRAVLKHELRHFTTAYNFSLNNHNEVITGDIYLFWFLPFDLKVKKRLHNLIFTRRILSDGLTELSNFYQSYTNDELKRIAFAGDNGKSSKKVQYDYCIKPMLIITMVMILALFLNTSIFCYSISLFIGDVIFIVCMMTHCKRILKRTHKDGYSDKRIIEDPSGFRDYKSDPKNNLNFNFKAYGLKEKWKKMYFCLGLDCMTAIISLPLFVIITVLSYNFKSSNLLFLVFCF